MDFIRVSFKALFELPDPGTGDIVIVLFEISANLVRKKLNLSLSCLF